jgi:hypothetical protein
MTLVKRVTMVIDNGRIVASSTAVRPNKPWSLFLFVLGNSCESTDDEKPVALMLSCESIETLLLCPRK